MRATSRPAPINQSVIPTNMRDIIIQYKRLFSAYVAIYVILGICSLKISIAGDRAIIPDDVVKQILQHQKLAVFLHPEIEGRVPIVIQSNFVNPNIELILYKKPIVVIPDSKKQLITNIYMSFFENGKVSINYPVEGVTGVFEFISDGKGNWKLENANIWEN